MIFSLLSKAYNLLYAHIHTKHLCHIGKGVSICRPLSLSEPKNISIDDNVYIGPFGWLFAVPLTGDNCHLHIMEGCSIGRFCHICATKRIIIEKNVLIAEKVYISDNLHSYDNIILPILDQPILQIQEVTIGEGSWLGENVCVIGASVGKHCVIGANSVVTRDIPDYCVAVGAPARVIKRYSFEKGEWGECV